MTIVSITNLEYWANNRIKNSISILHSGYFGKVRRILFSRCPEELNLSDFSYCCLREKQKFTERQVEFKTPKPTKMLFF